MVTTDYTEPRGIRPSLGRFNLTHWLCDELSLRLSQPGLSGNARLEELLRPSLEAVDPRRRLVRIGTPHSRDIVLACYTPAIMISVSQAQPTEIPLNCLAAPLDPVTYTLNGSVSCIAKSMQIQLAVVTESPDSTMLLADTVELAILALSKSIPDDCPAQAITYSGSSPVEMLPSESTGNPKPVFQEVISAGAFGSVAWETRTTAPVFRGVGIIIRQE